MSTESGLPERWLGRWKGTMALYLTGPPGPDSVSDSALEVTPVAKDKFLSFAYTWTFEEADQEGLLLVGGGGGKATSAWVDSFHMSEAIMACQGSVGADGSVDLLGSYQAPPGPDWGWRTTIESNGESLLVTMHNITPDGAETLAVRGAYEHD